MNRDRFIIILICVVAITFGLIVEFLPMVYLNIGRKDFNNGNYVAAYKNLSSAYLISPQNKDIRYYYAKVLSKLTPTYKIQQAMFEISDSDQRDSAKVLAELKIAEMKKRFIGNMSDNYIEQVPAEIGIVRWDINSFPLKVAFNTELKELPEYYEVQAFKALNQWQNSTNFLKFKIVDSADWANIIIEVKAMPNNVCDSNSCSYVLGNTVPDVEKGILKKMVITLYDKDPGGQYFSDKEIYNTILHELGHALGIMGHSFNPNDLMYMSDETSNVLFDEYRSAFQYISTADLNTISILYKMMPDVSNNPTKEISTDGLIYAPIILGNSKTRSSKKLKEADNYIAKAPTLPTGYIDRAIALSELNNVTEAIQSLEKAMTLAKKDEDKFVIYYNAAVIYLNNKMPLQAKPYAQKAKAISDTDDIENLLSDINKAIASGEDILKEQ